MTSKASTGALHGGAFTWSNSRASRSRWMSVSIRAAPLKTNSWEHFCLNCGAFCAPIRPSAADFGTRTASATVRSRLMTRINCPSRSVAEEPTFDRSSNAQRRTPQVPATAMNLGYWCTSPTEMEHSQPTHPMRQWFGQWCPAVWNRRSSPSAPWCE